MSIFSRIFKIGQAKVNQVVDSMEKPEVMLDQAIRDNEKRLVELKKAVASCIASVHQAEAQMNQEKKDQDKWEINAQAAIKAGKEDLALKALERAKEHENNAAQFESNVKNQQADVDKLKSDLVGQQNQLAEYKRNRDFIVAQSKFSEAKKDIHEARTKATGGKDIDNLMERMKKKAEKSSYEADAMEELSNDGSSLEKEFDSLEGAQTSSDLQAKLAEMKAKMGK